MAESPPNVPKPPTEAAFSFPRYKRNPMRAKSTRPRYAPPLAEHRLQPSNATWPRYYNAVRVSPAKPMAGCLRAESA